MGTLLQTFTNPTPASGDQFGGSLGISGNLALVGASSDDTDVNNSGATYLFEPEAIPEPTTIGASVIGVFSLFGFRKKKG